MITEDQSSVVRFLEAPSTHAGMPVERIEIHVTLVALHRRSYEVARCGKSLNAVEFSLGSE